MTRARNGVCARTTMSMTAGSEEPSKKESLGEWLYKKIMHNFANESYGYEPFHKEAMTAREEEAKRVYDEAGKEKE